MVDELNTKPTSVFLFTMMLLMANMQTISAVSLYGFSIILFGLIVFILCIKSLHVDLNVLLLALVFIILLSIVTFLQLPRYRDYSGLEKIFISRVLLSIYWIICIAMISGAIENLKKIQIEKSISIVIILMSSFVFIQTICYYLFNQVVDFSELTGGDLSRSYYGVLYRPSGFLPEPAMYSGHMTALMALYLFCKKKIDYVFYLGFISVFLTFSTAGMLLNILLYIVFSISHKKNMFFYLLFIVVASAFCIFILPLLFDRFDLFLNGGDASNNIKIDAVNNLLSHDDILYYGYGIIGRDHPSLPSYFDALRDLTIFGAFYTVFGVIIGTALLIVFTLFWLGSNLDFKYKVLLFIPLLKLSNPCYLFFYIYMLVYFLILKRGKHTEC